MTAQSRQKIMDAGFHVYRKDPHSKVIVCCTPRGGWARVTNHYTKKALNNAWLTLMKDPKSIAD